MIGVQLSDKLPIAVIDSGVGGISVLRELLAIMPKENYLYFGDSKNAPYGTKTKQEVLNITRENLSMLRSRGIKALVIACNTATSAAARILRAENPDLIIVGIEPAIKPASCLCDAPTVIVMATPLTLREEKFHSLLSRFEDKAKFIPLPCPGLVELIESGSVSGEKMDKYLEALFAPYKDQHVDAIVLGCTHYPHAKEAIAEHFPSDTVIIDGGEGTARETRRRLESSDLLKKGDSDGKVEILNSSGDCRLIELSEDLLYR